MTFHADFARPPWGGLAISLAPLRFSGRNISITERYNPDSKKQVGTLGNSHNH